MGHSYRDLFVWQKAKALAVQIYTATKNFPPELYGLRSQLRRAAVSVASDIAEGQGRTTKGEFQQFLGHARGSLLEIATQLDIAHDLGYIDDPATGDVIGLVNRLIESLQGKAAAAGY